MARRRRHRIEITLFPFLSVLVSVIGALALIIIGTALGSSAARMDAFPDVDAAAVRRAGLQARAEEQALAITIRNERLKKLQAELAKVVEFRLAVPRLQGAVRDRRKTGQDEQIHVSRLQAQVQAETKKLEQLLAQRMAGGKAVRITVPKAVAGKASFHPIFLDCRREGIVILQSGLRIPTDRLAADERFGKILALTKASKKSWCLFLLVRADGMAAFDKVFALVKAAGVRYGMHPVLTDKDFDVADWQKPDWLK